MEKTEKRTRHGHAVKRLRQSQGLKQEAVGMEMGMTQQMISEYEQKPVIEDSILQRLAKVLKVTPEVIKNLEEDPVTVFIENNTFEEGSIANVVGDNTNNYNPIEKILELSSEKQALYERMLVIEKEKVALLEQLLKEKK